MVYSTYASIELRLTDTASQVDPTTGALQGTVVGKAFANVTAPAPER